MIKTSIDQLKNSFKNKPEIISAYLIGSFASNNTGKESDFDLAVVVEDRKETTFKEVYKLIENVSFPADPDLSVVDLSSSPLFLYQIISRGEKIYVKDETKVIDFEARALLNYFDTQHIRSIYYSYLKDKFPKYAS